MELHEQRRERGSATMLEEQSLMYNEIVLALTDSLLYYTSVYPIVPAFYRVVAMQRNHMLALFFL